jgi:precorrin-6B methylase 1
LIGSQSLLDRFHTSRAHKLVYYAITESWLDRLETIPARPCVVLVSGDPGTSDVTRVFARHFGPRRCRVEPGVSAIQLACANLGVTWQNAAIVDVQTSTPNPLASPPADRDPWIFLMGHGQREGAIASLVEGSGRHAYLAEDLSLETQSIRGISPKELSTLAPRPRRLLIVTETALPDA